MLSDVYNLTNSWNVNNNVAAALACWSLVYNLTNSWNVNLS